MFYCVHFKKLCLSNGVVLCCVIDLMFDWKCIYHQIKDTCFVLFGYFRGVRNITLFKLFIVELKLIFLILWKFFLTVVWHTTLQDGVWLCFCVWNNVELYNAPFFSWKNKCPVFLLMTCLSYVFFVSLYGTLYIKHPISQPQRSLEV